MILIQLGLTRKPVEGLDEGSDVDFFSDRVNTEDNLFLFVTRPATNIP